MDQNFVGRIARLASAPAEVFWRECFLRSALTRQKSIKDMRTLGAAADACGRMYGIRSEGARASQLCAELSLIHI